MNLVLFATEAGFWEPLAMVAAFAIVTAIVYILRSKGVKSYSKTTEQTLPFFSGNIAPEENIKASNAYWGFFTAMGKYYGWAKGFHTGIVNDYIYFFVLLTVLIAALTLGVFLWA